MTPEASPSWGSRVSRRGPLGYPGSRPTGPRCSEGRPSRLPWPCSSRLAGEERGEACPPRYWALAPPWALETEPGPVPHPLRGPAGPAASADTPRLAPGPASPPPRVRGAGGAPGFLQRPWGRTLLRLPQPPGHRRVLAHPHASEQGEADRCGQVHAGRGGVPPSWPPDPHTL